jgi:hypothetical protein
MVKDWSPALPLLLLLALLLPLLLPALLPEIHALFIAGVDVWTDKGGHGWMNINGGRYNIGESITFYCSESFPSVDSLRIRAIWYGSSANWFELTLLERGPSPAGTYQASYSVERWGVGMWRVICEVRSEGQSFSDELLFGVPYPSDNPVDVWTNKGGQGDENPDGGEYTVGESITIYCEVRKRAFSLRITLIRPDGSEVVVLDRRDVQAGTYSVSDTVGESTGVMIVRCLTLFDAELGTFDGVGFNVRQGATATVTVYTTTTRTVTSTLHATATTETTTYTTTTRTLYTTFTRTWYTTVTTTVTTTITSWTTTTVRTTVMMSASYEVVLSLAALTPLASAYILRTRRRSRNSGGVVRG